MTFYDVQVTTDLGEVVVLQICTFSALVELDVISAMASITKMKDEQLEKFNTIEESMLKLQRQFECRTKQYIQVQKDGGLKKYISVQNV